MKKIIVAIVLMVSILCATSTAYASTPNDGRAKSVYIVWYGDETRNLTMLQFRTLAKKGSLYLTAFDDVIMDLGWKAVSKGRTYRVIDVNSELLYISDDAGIKHGFTIGRSAFWSSYATWFSVHYYAKGKRIN